MRRRLTVSRKGGAAALRRTLAIAGLGLALAGCVKRAEPLPPVPLFDAGAAMPAAGPTVADFVRYAGSASVGFSAGSADLSAHAEAILDRQVQWLKRHPHVPIALLGHADQLGSREERFVLGQRRAAAIKFHMVSGGIAQGRITLLSLGKERPAAGGFDDAARREDNRGETVLIGVPAGQ